MTNEDQGSLPICPGSICGPFRIEERLGFGGMGEVFCAERTDGVKMHVALKVLTRLDDDALRMFRKECDILAGLEHPNIARLIDVGTTFNGQHWLAMEFVDGSNLDTYLEKHSLSLRERLKLFLKICDGVAFAHQQMVIHRDLKPDNIRINLAGEPKVLDFGIAATLDPSTGAQDELTLRADRFLTPQYASPEQINGERLNATSDVYSLGVLLYKMLTGVLPYAMEDLTPAAVLKAVNETNRPRPSLAKPEHPPVDLRHLRGDIDLIVQKAMQREQKARYAGVDALAADVQAWLKGLPIQARPMTFTYQMRAFVKRYPWPFALAGLLVAFLSVFSVNAQQHRRLLEFERDKAMLEQQKAEQINDFLTALFDQVDPDIAQGGDVSAYDVMEMGRLQIDNADNIHPEVRALLRLTMGRVYRSLGDYEQSQTLLSMNVGKESGTVNVELLLELTRTLLSMGKHLEAKQGLADLAVEEWEPLHQGQFHHLMGKIHSAQGLYIDAGDAFQKSMAFRLVLPVDVYHSLLLDRAELDLALDRKVAAEALIGELLGLQIKHHGFRHSAVAKSYMKMAKIKRHQAEFDAADKALGEAEKIYAALYANDHPTLVRCFIERALLLQERGLYVEAAEVLDKGHKLSQKFLGESHPLALRCLYIQGKLMLIKGKPREAEALFREVLGFRRKTLGEYHHKVADCYERLGQIFRLRGAWDDANAVFDKALWIYREQFGESHPKVAEVINSQAIVKQSQGSLAEAEAMYKESLKLAQKSMGMRHVRTAHILQNLASNVNRQGRPEDAEHFYRDAIAIKKEAYGSDHDSIALSMRNLATLLAFQGRYEEAEKLHFTALEMRKRVLGEDHIKIGSSFVGLGFLMHEVGNYEALFEYATKARTIFDKELPKNHPRQLGVDALLGKAYFDIGEYETFIKLMNDKVKISRELYGEHSPAELYYLSSMIDVHIQLGDFQEALGLFKIASGKFDHVYDSEDSAIDSFLIQRARLALRMGDLSDVETWLGQLREPVRKGLEKAPLVRGLWLQKQGKLDAAARVYANTLKQDPTAKGSKAIWVLKVKVHFSEVMLEKGSPDGAVAHIDAILDDFGPLLQEHEYLHLARAVKGAALVELGDLENGHALLSAAYEALLKRFGSNHYYPLEVKARLDNAQR